MKKYFLFSALFSLALLTSCTHEDIEIDVIPTSEDIPAVITISEGNSLNNSVSATGRAFFTINNEDNTLYEQDALLLADKSIDAVEYHWDFGNGDESTEANPMHTYDIHGYYTVTLTTTDSEGKQYQASDEILVLCLFGGGNHDQ